MKMKILQAGETVLRKKAQALSRDEIRNKETQQLIEWMRETMHEAPGVGLAAPQVGVSQQIAVRTKPNARRTLRVGGEG